MIDNNPDNNEVVIFTGFANPTNNLLNLSKEQKGIHEVLHPLESQQLLKKHLWRQDLDVKGYFEFLQEWTNQISIFHFGGHANSTQLGFQDHAAFFGSLAEELIERNKESLWLVFLNGCSTQAHVQTLFDGGVKAVIATSAAVKDDLAAELAIWFYKYLAKGDNIKNAFNSSVRYLKSLQKIGPRYRILEQPVEWASRGSVKFSRQDEEDDQLPWGLYVNDAQALNYTIVRDKSGQNPSTQVIQGNQINTASDQGTIISGPVEGGITITHHHRNKDNTN